MKNISARLLALFFVVTPLISGCSLKGNIENVLAPTEGQDQVPSIDLVSSPQVSSKDASVTIEVSAKGFTGYAYKVGLKDNISCSSLIGYTIVESISTSLVDLSNVPDGQVRMCIAGVKGNEIELSKAKTYDWNKDTTPPGMPATISLSSPSVSPGSSTTPAFLVSGTFVVGDTVKIFSNSACGASSLLAQQTTFGLSLTLTAKALPADAIYSVYAQSEDPLGNKSACSTAFAVYELDRSIITAGADSATLAMNGTADISVLSNDSDSDGDALLVLSTSQGASGVVSINPNKTVRYVPGASFTGQDSFTYVAGDGNGNNATATVTVRVIGPFTWVGTTGNGNFSTAGNWFGGAVPNSSQVAIFENVCGSNCNVLINSSISVGGIKINSDFTGSITQGAASTIAVSSSGWDQSGGSFQASTAAISMGKFSLSAGTFTSTSGILSMTRSLSSNVTDGFTVSGSGSFLHNSGTINFNGSIFGNCSGETTAIIDAPGVQFNNFIVNTNQTGCASWAAVVLATNTSIRVNGLLSLKDGQLDGGTVDLYGNLSVECTGASVCAGAGSTIIEAKGSAAQTYAFQAGGKSPAIKLSKSSGTFSAAAGTTAFAVNKLELISGQFVAPSGTLEVGLAHGGSNATDGFLVSAPANFAHNSGTVLFNGTVWANCGSKVTNLITATTGVTFNNLTIDANQTNPEACGYHSLGSVDLAAGTVLDVLGKLHIYDGTLESGVINAYGDLELNCSTATVCAEAGTTRIIMSGTAVQSYIYETGAKGPQLEINKTGGSVAAAAGTTDLRLTKFTLTAGTFTAPSGTLQIGLRADWTISDATDGFTVLTGSTFNHNNGTLKFDGAAYANCGSTVTSMVFVPSGLNLFNLTIAADQINPNACGYSTLLGSVNFATGTNINILGNLSIEDGAMMGGLLNLSGNLVLGCASAFVCAEGEGTTRVAMVGSGVQTYTAQGAARGPVLEINKTGGSVGPAGGTTSLYLSKFLLQAGSFTAPSGTMAVGFYRYLVGDAIDGFTVMPSGTFTHNSGTLLLDGSIWASCGDSVTNVIDVNSSLALNNLHIKANQTNPGACGGHTLGVVTIASGDTLNLAGELKVIDGTLNGGQINLSSNIIYECASTASCAEGGSTQVTMVGASAQQISIAAGSIPLEGNMVINKTNFTDTVTLNQNLNLSGSTQTVTVTKGHLRLNGQALTVPALFSVPVGSSLTCSGGSYTAGSSSLLGTISCP